MKRRDKEAMPEILTKVQEILGIIAPDKKWRIEYLVFESGIRQRFSEWDITWNHLRIGDEYLCIWNDEGFLLYTINVSANSVTSCLAELFELIADKF